MAKYEKKARKDGKNKGYIEKQWRGNYEYIKGKDDTKREIVFGKFRAKLRGIPSSVKDFLFDDHLLGTFLVGAALVIGLPLGHLAGASVNISKTTENAQYKLEEAVTNSTESARFTVKAFTATKNEQGSCVEIFGTRIPQAGNVPEFVSATYPISDELYDKIVKHTSINYTYAPDGRVVDAETVIRDLSIMTMNDERAYRDIMQELVEVTKDYPLTINDLGNSANPASTLADLSVYGFDFKEQGM